MDLQLFYRWQLRLVYQKNTKISTTNSPKCITFLSNNPVKLETELPAF